MNDSQTWAFAKDAQWREELRRVSLVAELDVDDDELERSIALLGLLLRVNSPDLVRRRLPAFLVVALTATGMREWYEGTFYRYVSEALDVPQHLIEEAAREFPIALARLGLPTFSEAGGMRWVTPVLLHGAVPLDHLDELVVLLARRRRRDPSLDGDAFVEWVRTSPEAMRGQPKALARFLEFGGDFAPDFVTRVMDFCDGEPAALPRRVEDRLASLLADGLVREPTRRQARPSIGRSGSGAIVLRLPSVKPAEGRTVAWRVSMDGRAQTIEAHVPYEVHRETTLGVTLGIDQPTRAVTVERDGRSATLPFVRKDDPLLVFDDRGDLVAASAHCPAGRCVVMWPGLVASDIEVRRAGSPRWVSDALEMLEVPYGWEGWSAARLQLAAGDGVRLHGSTGERRVRPDTRARFVEPSALDAVCTLEGLPILGERPTLVLPHGADPSDWSVTVSDVTGEVMTRFVPSSTRGDALGGLPGHIDAEVVIAVRGPLGRGVTRRFAVAEGVNVTSTPPYRALEPAGLRPATVLLHRGIQTLAHVTLSSGDRGQIVPVGESLRLWVSPPHPEFAVVSEGTSPIWGITPRRLTPEDVAEVWVAVRHLPEGVRPTLVLESAGMTQQVSPVGGDRVTSSATFSLGTMADHARDAGTGTVWLVAGARIPVVHLRPRRLAEECTVTDGHVQVNTDVSGPLEVTVHRLLAPWEPGEVLTLVDHVAPLPQRLAGAGPLRLRVRVPNDWAPEPAGSLPWPGRDVFDAVDLPWDADAEPDAQRDLMAYLTSDTDPVDVAPRLGEQAFGRALMLLDAGPALRGVSLAPHRAALLVRADPARALRSSSATALSEDALTVALVESGLVAVSAPACGLPVEDVESLLPRSALAACLAGSSALREEPDGPTAHLLGEYVGPELAALRAGDGRESAVLGRFETYFLQVPAAVRSLYDLLAPVPGLLLDGDTRIAAAYQLWQARARLQPQARAAMGTVARARRLLTAERPDLLPLLEARFSGDGVLGLPVLCLALGLLARMAAHGSDAAVEAYELVRFHHGPLAREAALMCQIDLVRADAAVNGDPS